MLTATDQKQQKIIKSDSLFTHHRIA